MLSPTSKRTKHIILFLIVGFSLAIASVLFPLLWSDITVAQTPASTITERVLSMERRLEEEFEDYFGEDLATVTQTPADISQILKQVGVETQTNPAVMWVIPKQDHLRLVLITARGETIERELFDVTPRVLKRTVQAFRQEVSAPNRRGPMVGARQLYRWIIEPYEADYLEAEGIDTILFCLGKGIRGIPMTALYDGEKFLVESYRVSRIPAFNLIQTDYQPLEKRQILAMGASEFAAHEPLPAVPTELDAILWSLDTSRRMMDRWDGQTFLNQDFTVDTLREHIEANPFDVVHLATHAEFRPGNPSQSYIQFWDRQLGLDQTGTVDWDLPPLELLVLSACRTALGDDTAELGFAGLALKAGVKSAIASLWYVSDFGTLALMSDFYQHLGVTTTKAAALRQAQLNMLHGDVRVEDNQLVLSEGKIVLPPELQSTGLEDLSHPFYWAGFTLISSPW
ncbi:MAG: CHAT domain-containing protein [Cyanobacteria bacterium P01_F01_bin.150]